MASGLRLGLSWVSSLTQKDGAFPLVALRCPSPSRIWGILSGHSIVSPAGFVEGPLLEVVMRRSRAQAGEGVVAMMALWGLLEQIEQLG